MNNLTKRISALERTRGTGKRKKEVLWVDYVADGGLVYEGQLYESATALLHALEYEPGDKVQVVGWQLPQPAMCHQPSENHDKPATTIDALARPDASPVLSETEHRQKSTVRSEYSVARPRFWGEYFDIESS